MKKKYIRQAGFWIGIFYYFFFLLLLLFWVGGEGWGPVWGTFVFFPVVLVSKRTTKGHYGLFILCAFYILLWGCRSALAELQPINFLSVELDLGFSVALLSSVTFNALSCNEICNNGLLVLNMKFQL